MNEPPAHRDGQSWAATPAYPPLEECMPAVVAVFDALAGVLGAPATQAMEIADETQDPVEAFADALKVLKELTEGGA